MKNSNPNSRVVSALRATLPAMVAVLALASPSVKAGQLPLFNAQYPTPNSACATFGDLISCSTKALDYLDQQGYAGFTGPYSFSTAQGPLKQTIVLGVNGGEIAENADLLATGSEDGFKTITPGKSYFFTGETDNNNVSNDPTNNGNLAGDTPYSWDISLSGLIDSLTFAGAFHQMLIGFDMNESQNSTASLPIWALLTVRDVEGGTNLAGINFETQNLNPADPFADPALFTSTKSFDGSALTTPSGSDFAMTVGAICVVNPLVSYPSPNGSSCPQGGALVNTNQASNELEFINYLPELDLKHLYDLGYDTISVQIRMGCFGIAGNSKSGPALAGGTSIGPCDSAGFGDIFLLAGAAESQVSEPGTLALAGLALTMLGAGLRRRKEAAKT